ncbi:uncharacterized protein LOC111871146 [Cryptotermes secundus]|uniref:uncharacterized protein LOC111871146 n=1 Tax=Cryptotermes secundus TaxID=105785 RepID=UPI000CD7AEAB|nr:uncharacterized protein LOC111871146 [Cryptotermes secundus]
MEGCSSGPQVQGTSRRFRGLKINSKKVGGLNRQEVLPHLKDDLSTAAGCTRRTAKRVRGYLRRQILQRLRRCVRTTADRTRNAAKWIFHFFTCAPLLANSEQQTVARRIGNIEAQVLRCPAWMLNNSIPNFQRRIFLWKSVRNVDTGATEDEEQAVVPGRTHFGFLSLLSRIYELGKPKPLQLTGI